jgi:hypothetical protein
LIIYIAEIFIFFNCSDQMLNNKKDFCNHKCISLCICGKCNRYIIYFKFCWLRRTTPWSLQYL